MGIHSGMFILVCACDDYKTTNQPIYEEFVQNQRPDFDTSYDGILFNDRPWHQFNLYFYSTAMTVLTLKCGFLLQTGPRETFFFLIQLIINM